MMHLDPERYALLVGGTLPPEEARALAEHLSGDCEICERFLADAPADGLDGRGDAAIAGAFPPPTVPGGELEFARIRRRLRAHGLGRHVAPAAIAASLLLAGVAGLLAPRHPPQSPQVAAWDGLKGTAAPRVGVRLRAVRLDAAGGATPLRDGEPAAEGARLLFEVEADRGADVALVHLGAGGAEVLWRRRIAAGRTVVTTDDRAAAWTVAGPPGAQRFALVAAPEGFDDDALARATAVLSAPEAPAGDAAPAGISADVLEIRVR